MAEAKTAAAPSKPKKEPTKKGNIAKEIIFAILFFLSFLLVWIGISIKFNPESAKDLLFYSDKSYLVLFLSAGLLGITTAFVGMYIQRYWLIAIALGLSIISYFFFLPFGIFSLIILIILFATGTAGYNEGGKLPELTPPATGLGSAASGRRRFDNRRTGSRD